MHRPVRITAPAALPVSLEEAQEFLRTDHEDAVVEQLIATAVEHLDGWDGILGICLEEQTWRQDFDAFDRILRLPLKPVIAISSITYRDSSDIEATVSSDEYSFRTDAGGFSYVRFRDAYSLPSDLSEVAAVSVTYTAGHPRAEGVSTVPAPLRAAIKAIAAHLYEHREAVGEKYEIVPMSAYRFLGQYQRFQI